MKKSVRKELCDNTCEEFLRIQFDINTAVRITEYTAIQIHSTVRNIGRVGYSPVMLKLLNSDVECLRDTAAELTILAEFAKNNIDYFSAKITADKNES